MTGAVHQALARFGRLDIVVANAAVFPSRGPVLQCSPGERLALYVAELPPWEPTGQVFSLAGRLL